MAGEEFLKNAISLFEHVQCLHKRHMLSHTIQVSDVYHYVSQACTIRQKPIIPSLYPFCRMLHRVPPSMLVVLKRGYPGKRKAITLHYHTLLLLATQLFALGLSFSHRNARVT